VTWTLPDAVLAAIVEHAREARPAECCGVLIGRPRAILESVRTHNLADDPNRYLIDPKDHIDARRAARERGLEVVGFYHSHPRTAAHPSPTDVADATYPDCVYLIVSLRAEPPAVRLFSLSGDRANELTLLVD
jgi:proteasome lid subunit RPN8/RPN11